jgi:hypothetical protein
LRESLRYEYMPESFLKALTNTSPPKCFQSLPAILEF